MRYLFSSLIVCVSLTSFSQSISESCRISSAFQLQRIPLAVSSLHIAPDARSAGLGDAGLGLSPDANSLYWNAAAVGFSEKRTEVSVSYSPWFRQLVNGIHHLYYSSYIRLGKRHALGSSIRHFQAGAMEPFTQEGVKESEFQLSYVFRVSKRSAIGISGKFIYSNVDAGFFTPCGMEIHPGTAGAVDLSYRFRGNERSIGKAKARWNWGFTLSNMGNKIEYVEVQREFLPANLRLGSSFDLDFNPKHGLTFVLNTNKLLVPTPPVEDGTGSVVSGMDDNVGTFVGMIHSFYDAPGQITTSPTGATTVSGRGQEEFREWMWNGGLEYNFDDILFIRSGLSLEHESKGIRNFLTLGAGTQWKFLSLDFSYLQAFRRTNPLNTTIRFTVSAKLPGNDESSMKPPAFE